MIYPSYSTSSNLRISQYIQKRLKLSNSQVYNNIMKYGNTTAASIPIALKEALDENKLNKGDILCLAAFGVVLHGLLH